MKVVYNMASTLELIKSSNNGATSHLRALVKGGANINTSRNGITAKEYMDNFYKAEPRKKLLRQNTTSIDHTCSRFFNGDLQKITVLTPDSFEIGKQVYVIEKELGAGTFGLVVKAVEQESGLEVAVKFMFGENLDAQRSELAMQDWLSCILTEKPPTSLVPKIALVPKIYTLVSFENKDGDKVLDILQPSGNKQKHHITTSMVGIMELLGDDLETLLINTPDDSKKVPIVKQVLNEVANTIKYVNGLSIAPAFVHGDLHTGNVMYRKSGNNYQFYIMDLGMTELIHGGERQESPNTVIYPNRLETNKFRHIGSAGNDLFTLCISMVEMFQSVQDNLPELFLPIRDFFSTNPEGSFTFYKREARRNKKSGPLPSALTQFQNENSPFYLGCKPSGLPVNGKGRWPLGQDKDGDDLPLFHYYGYDVGDEDKDVTTYFEPTYFIEHYLSDTPDTTDTPDTPDTSDTSDTPDTPVGVQVGDIVVIKKKNGDSVTGEITKIAKNGKVKLDNFGKWSEIYERS